MRQCLKYQRIIPSGCKDKSITKSKSVTIVLSCLYTKKLLNSNKISSVNCYNQFIDKSWIIYLDTL